MIALYLTLALFVGAMIAVFIDQKKKKAALDDFKQHAGKNLTSEKCSGAWMTANLILPVLMVLFAAYVVFSENAQVDGDPRIYAAVILVMAVGFTVYIFMERPYQDLYMDRDSFYHQGSVYRFSSVKTIERGGKNMKVTCYNGDTFKVNQVKGMAIQNHMDEVRRENAQRREEKRENKGKKRKS